MRKALSILKPVIAVVLIVSMVFFMGACSSGSKPVDNKEGDMSSIKDTTEKAAENKMDGYKPLRDKAKYTFMIFEVGTDLESTERPDGTLQGCISNDLKEMMEVGSNNDLNILVETGGTRKWVIDKISNTKNQRWLMKKGDMELEKDDLGNCNMGDPATLEDFMVWGVKSYPADKYVLVLGDHGGGVTGFGVDELNNGDGLTLKEIQTAFKNAYSRTSQKFEIIGFDACLMATLETASIASPYANYFVASEETEPGHGWFYVPIMNSIQQSPEIDGRALGQVICDGFKQQGTEWGDAEECTLSVTELSKVGDLVKSLEAFVSKAGTDIAEPDRFFRLAEARSKSEDYGNSGGAHGDSTDQVDLGDLAKKSQDLYPAEASALLQKINEAIVYKLPGCQSKPDANGISIYLPCKDKNGMPEKVDAIDKIEYSQVYKDFVKKYAEKIQSDTTPVEFTDNNPKVEEGMLRPGAVASLDNKFIAAGSQDERFEVKIKKEDINSIDNIYSVLGKYAEGSTSKVLFLGLDTDVDFDENTGSVKDNFDGTWVTLGGQFVSMFLEEENEEYSLYNIPVKLNGEEVDIKVLYNYKTGKEEVMGAWKGIDEKTGMADKNIIKIKQGDKIVPLYYSYDFNTDKDGMEEGKQFVVGSDIKLEADTLPSGNYLYGFYVVDLAQNESYSEFVDINLSASMRRDVNVAMK